LLPYTRTFRDQQSFRCAPNPRKQNSRLKDQWSLHFRVANRLR
jgi:hypothetical protein